MHEGGKNLKHIGRDKKQQNVDPVRAGAIETHQRHSLGAIGNRKTRESQRGKHDMGG